MMGPLGVLSPAPGVSYLFQGAEGANHSNDGEGGSLWGIANASGNVHASGGLGTTSALMSPPASWSPHLGEMMLKIDGKLKVRFQKVHFIFFQLKYLISVVMIYAENYWAVVERARPGRAEWDQGRAGIIRSFAAKPSYTR